MVDEPRIGVYEIKNRWIIDLLSVVNILEFDWMTVSFVFNI